MNGYSNFVIQSPNTDVFIIALALSADIKGYLYFKTETGNGAGIISIDDVLKQVSLHASKLGVDNTEYKQCILGLYCFTGYDTISAFAGKGKLKALKIVQQEKDFLLSF